MTEVVTREHRVAALAAFGWADAIGTKNSVATWVETGVADGNLIANQTLPMVAQGIASAEARGRAEASAEVARLTAELAELRSQANEYGPAPGMALADRERLAADMEMLRQALLTLGVPAKNAHDGLNRIEAALGIGERTAATETDLAGLDPHTT